MLVRFHFSEKISEFRGEQIAICRRMRSRTFLGRKVLELSKELPEKRDKNPVLFPEIIWTESGVLRLS